MTPEDAASPPPEQKPATAPEESAPPPAPEPKPEPPLAPEPAPEPEGGKEPEGDAEVLRQIERLRTELVTLRGGEMTDLMAFLRSRRRLGLLNFVLGLARGLGFFLGVSLLGALLVAGVAWFVDWTAGALRANFDTRTLVRSAMTKYSEVMEEVEQARAESDREGIALPSATAAQIGVLLSRAASEDVPPEEDPSEGAAPGGD